MAEHTPGPWRWIVGDDTEVQIDGYPSGPDYPVLIGSDGMYVAGADEYWTFGPHGGFGRTMTANARLIAAAPDLLLALQELLFCARHGNGLEAHYKARDRAAAAIAKATGVPHA